MDRETHYRFLTARRQTLGGFFLPSPLKIFPVQGAGPFYEGARKGSASEFKAKSCEIPTAEIISHPRKKPSLILL